MDYYLYRNGVTLLHSGSLEDCMKHVDTICDRGDHDRPEWHTLDDDVEWSYMDERHTRGCVVGETLFEIRPIA